MKEEEEPGRSSRKDIDIDEHHILGDYNWSTETGNIQHHRRKGSRRYFLGIPTLSTILTYKQVEVSPMLL